MTRVVCQTGTIISEKPWVSVIKVELQAAGLYALVAVYQTTRYHVPDVSYSFCVFKKSMTLLALLVYLGVYQAVVGTTDNSGAQREMREGAQDDDEVKFTNGGKKFDDAVEDINNSTFSYAYSKQHMYLL